MKSVRSFRSAAAGSALPRRPAASVSIFQLKILVRAALLVLVAGASLAAMAHHHGWLASLAAGDGAMPAATASDPFPESAPAGTFTKIDVAGAGAVAMEGTFAVAINTAGDVTGMYSDSPGTLHGFVRAADGVITKFDASDSGTSAIEGTIPLSINTAGEIAGTFIDSNHVSHGFVRNVNGVITEFDAPGAGTSANRGTAAWRINDAGEVVGFFSTDGSSSAPPTYHGFLRRANGTFAILDDPDAGTGLNPANGKKQGTQAYSINNAGEIVGSYVDSSNDRHGFLYTNGSFTEIDAPGAITSTTGHKESLNGTLPTGIDADGVVVGTFTDAKGRHGFVRSADGAYEVFDGPGAAASSAVIPGTIPFDIESATGSVVGFDSDATGFYHAFERSAAGAVVEIKPPGAVGSALTPLPGAGAGGVNEYGDVAGGYSDANGAYHGFIFTPTSTPQAAKPVFTVKPGTYDSEVSVRITDATKGAAIYYTLNGAKPSDKSARYSAPFPLSRTTTVEAIAIAPGYTNSGVAIAKYTILKLQKITWPKITGSHAAGTKLTLKATASSGLAVAFSSETLKICTVTKDTASLLKAGTCTLRASQAGNSSYAPAPSVTQSLTVKASD
jgi:probable HAF family extracellular repeat protein